MQTHKHTWWDNNLSNKNTFKIFTEWLGDDMAASRIWFRKYLKENPNYSSILDVGCGPAIDYYAYPKHNINIKYTGVDSSIYLNERNKKLGIEMIQSEAHNIPVKDSAYDIAYSRHVLEHQPDFRANLKELIRIGSKLAVHIFFIKPSEVNGIKYNSEMNLWHNSYNIKDIEQFLLINTKVKSFEWHNITEEENILIINLNE
jgi:ubiquinone/menaquinone biosynthesis C-methylase UbiE